MKYAIFILMTLAFALPAQAKKVHKRIEYRKTQKVDFSQEDINGKVRTPDGAYLMQKRAVKFMPLYKVDNQFEKNILNSIDYLR